MPPHKNSSHIRYWIDMRLAFAAFSFTMIFQTRISILVLASAGLYIYIYIYIYIYRCICLSLDGEYFGMVRSVRPIVSSSNEYAVSDKKFSETFQFSIKDIRMLVHIFFYQVRYARLHSFNYPRNLIFRSRLQLLGLKKTYPYIIFSNGSFAVSIKKGFPC